MDTMGAMMSGILSIPCPVTEIPEGRETVDGSGDDSQCLGTEAIVAALEAGKLVSASNYYGIPKVWKESDGVYRGTLLARDRPAVAPTFSSAEEAAKWFNDRYYSTDG